MGRKDELGRTGEALAAAHLREQGMRILGRNWRCREGEIDLIAVIGETLVFVEVKTRSGVRHGEPLEAITEAKAQRMRRLADAWLLANGPHDGLVRFDAVAVRLRSGQASVEHVEGIAS